MTWPKIIVGVGVAAVIIIVGGKKLPFFNRVSNGREKSLNEKMKDYYLQLRRMCDRVAEGKPDNSPLFEEELSRCFEVWCQLQRTTKEEERANIVLSGFHGNDRLKSKLSDVCEYVNTELAEEIDAAGIVSSGFNSCLNFAWLDYKRMRDKLEGVSLESDLKPDIYDFCREMSYRGGAFSALYKALSMGRDRIERGMPVSYEDEALCRLLMNVIHSQRRPEDYGIGEATTELKSKLKNQARTIADAKDLLQNLESLMREDRLLAMRDQSASVETLKSLYQKMAQEVDDLLQKYGES